MTSRQWIDRVPKEFRVSITPKNEDGEVIPAGRIYAALPDSFGMSVGSAFSDPFNNDMSAGKLNGAFEKITAYTGFGRKLGSRVTSLFFNGPEPTEMSMELQFEAYYSAFAEVIVPIRTLMQRSVGTDKGIDELIQKQVDASNESRSFLDYVPKILGDEDGSQNWIAEQLGDILQVIQGPPLCDIRLGRVLTFREAYISSVGANFSNVLDNMGLPMSGTASLTIKLKKNPVQSDIIDFFANATEVPVSGGFQT